LTLNFLLCYKLGSKTILPLSISPCPLLNCSGFLFMLESISIWPTINPLKPMMNKIN